MAIEDDFSIAVNGDIRYVGTTATYTVLELHRFVQDRADDAVSMADDFLDITDSTPSDRSTDNIISLINGFNIDDNAAKFLFDGSIIQSGGNTIYDGIVNFGNTSKINVMQDGALIADDFWNANSPSGFNDDPNQGISHRFLVKVRDAGVDIDGRRLLGMSRQINKTWSEFPINGTSRGNNVLALSEADDLNNQTAEATIATWTDIVNDNEGFTGIDANGDGANENYYADWEYGTRSVNDFYERTKWLSRDGSAETLYGLSGDIFRGITHEIDIDTPTGTFVEPEEVSWAGGTGQLLAIDSTTAGTKMYIQLLTGAAPVDNDTITGTSGATADVNVTVTERAVSVPWVGASTGSAIIAAYGLGIGADDLSASDQVTDLTGALQTPPNNVSFSVNGLIVGEDRVLVGPEDGAGGLDYDQLSLSTSLSGAAETSVVVTSAIPSDTPATGTIRVATDTGIYELCNYTSYTGSTFTIAAKDFSADPATSGNDVFISYIDVLATASTESFTSVFLSPRTLFVRVRDGAGSPIKTFETTGTLGSAGGSTTAIRTSDA